VVTRGLLNILETEGELVSILAHEMGHIERSHCLNIVKYELLAKKIGDAELGRFADLITAIFLRQAFSKTQENEADEYAFQLLEQTQYDPHSVGQAFQRLLDYQKQYGYPSVAKQEADVIRDYLLSHPPVEIRIDKFTSQAKTWWRRAQGKERRYVGKRNLAEQNAFPKTQYPEEWRP
jgi:beta-barrel assembly-enhancing protease